MTIVHIANTDVEFEYAGSSHGSIEESWSRHALCLQLQFLPLLYAKPDDIVAVTALPDQAYLSVLRQSGLFSGGLPRLALLKEKALFEGLQCVSWGPSRHVQQWALARRMDYAIPADWQMICRINSKAFSFNYNSLSEAALLANENELIAWLEKVPGPKVLKTSFGLSGMGNWVSESSDLHPSPELLAFCRKEWSCARPIIAEPWLDRLLDFSTQWMIHANQRIEWVGATRFETDSRGIYQGTLAGPEDLLFGPHISFLQQHRQYVLRALKEIAAMGFFGSIGFDALLYKDSKDQSVRLYPLVEINGRQTMSLVALRLQQRHCPDQILRLAFQSSGSSQSSLLPDQCLKPNGKMVRFSRYLTVSIRLS